MRTLHRFSSVNILDSTRFFPIFNIRQSKLRVRGAPRSCPGVSVLHTAHVLVRAEAAFACRGATSLGALALGRTCRQIAPPYFYLPAPVLQWRGSPLPAHWGSGRSAPPAAGAKVRGPARIHLPLSQRARAEINGSRLVTETSETRSTRCCAVVELLLSRLRVTIW